jgi:hypothetical protein
VPACRPPASELASGGPAAAYARLGDHGIAALPGLGPAFGTKFLYFCSPPGDRTALILDRLVAEWLRGNAGLRLNEVRWSAQAYQHYLTTMSDWASEAAIPPDDLEACIFRPRPAPQAASGQRARPARECRARRRQPDISNKTAMYTVRNERRNGAWLNP